MPQPCCQTCCLQFERRGRGYLDPRSPVRPIYPSFVNIIDTFSDISRSTTCWQSSCLDLMAQTGRPCCRMYFSYLRTFLADLIITASCLPKIESSTNDFWRIDYRSSLLLVRTLRNGERSKWPGFNRRKA